MFVLFCFGLFCFFCWFVGLFVGFVWFGLLALLGLFCLFLCFFCLLFSFLSFCLVVCLFVRWLLLFVVGCFSFRCGMGGTRLIQSCTRNSVKLDSGWMAQCR